MMWWQFGTATESALRTFQACLETALLQLCNHYDLSMRVLLAVMCNTSEMLCNAVGFFPPVESCSPYLQGMNGLPETGVSDAGTWRALLGQSAQPADLADLHSKEAQFDDDMSEHTSSVWLLVCASDLLLLQCWVPS